MNRTFFCILVLSVGIGCSLLGQTVPQLINYQGRLANPGGSPFPTADYELSLRIYDATGNGALVWGPQVFDGGIGPGHGARVPVVQGYFNVVLGPVDTNGNSLVDAFGGSNRFVEVTVSNRPPVLPRQQILSTPYALTAGSLIRDLQEALCPPGTIMAFGGDGTNIPTGWLLCDGRAVSRTAYSRLFAAIHLAWGQGDAVTTFHIPDLRGMFLRGVNHGRIGQFADPGATGREQLNTGGNAANNVGSYQSSQTGDHSHSQGNLTARIYVSGNNNVWYDSRTISAWAADSIGANAADVRWPSGDTTTSGAIVVGRTDPNTANTTEARPSNVYVNYIIKY